MNPLRNENGAILIIALWVLLILSLLGSMALRTSQIELMIAGNDKLVKQAFYQAESAVNLAQADMKQIWADWKEDVENGEWVWMNDGFTRTFDSSDYPLIANFDFEFDVTLKSGLDEFDNPVPIFWDGEAENIKGDGFPIVTITGTGYSPDRNHPRNAVQVVEIQIRAAKFIEDVPAPLYLDGILTMQMVSPTFKREYNPNCYGTCDDPRMFDIVAPSYPDDDGNPDTKEYEFDLKSTGEPWGECGESVSTEDADIYQVSQVANRLSRIANVKIEPGKYSNLYLGSADDQYNIFLCDGNLELNNVEDKNGFGVLVVKGDLVFGGNINWHGLIIVTGDNDPNTPAIQFNGGGSQEIRGAVMAAGDVVLKGTPDFWYDCEWIFTLQNKTFTYQRLWWRQK